MPDFASQEYWENRFTKDTGPFDWLVPAATFGTIATHWTESDSLRGSEILHIGCGTSDAFVFRELVDSPEQIHNVDYSTAAICVASQRERQLLGDNDRDAEDSSLATMRWSSLDLLSLDSTLSLMDDQAARGRPYDIVLDKSTSDSISCGADVSLRLPYGLSINGWTRRITSSGASHIGKVHPLHALAVNLAALTTPKTGKWIVVSYSEDRFPFLPPFPAGPSQGLLTDDIVQAGFPHPRQLWRLEAKERIDLAPDHEETLAERKKRIHAGIVHRPQLSHWLYVLVRTEALVTD